MLKKSTQYQSNKLTYIGIVVTAMLCVICCLVSLVPDNPAGAEYVSVVCNAVKNMDFTIREPRLDITAEEDRLYKEAYLQVLKNEMPILDMKFPKRPLRKFLGKCWKEADCL